MKRRTPVLAFRLFSSPSNKPIIFDSFYETSCMFTNNMFTNTFTSTFTNTFTNTITNICSLC